MSVALVTGASRGLGAALAATLVDHGWEVIVDARDAAALREAVAATRRPDAVQAVVGDVTDPEHREALAAAVAVRGGLDLLVNNAGTLGPTPLPVLAGAPLDGLRHAFEVNLVAPLALTQLMLPFLRAARGVVVNVTSDAAVEAYPGWGVYGATKAALEHLSAVLAVECPELRVLAVDPGDMRTRMQQDAFPGEDVSDRADPAEVAPLVLALVLDRRASGRYRAADVAAAAGVVA